MHVAVNDDGVRAGRQRSGHRAYIMFAIIVHDVIGGNEGRYVTSCFLRKIRIDLPIIPASPCASDSLVYVGRPAVVGSNDQSPVAENLIKVLQVMCGCIRGFDGVTTFVYQTIDIEAVHFTGRNHELPQSGCTDPGGGSRVEGGLDDRQVFQFQG